MAGRSWSHVVLTLLFAASSVSLMACSRSEPSAGDSDPAAMDPKPGGSDLKPAGSDPKPAGSDPKPAGSDPKSAGSDPKPSAGGLDPERSATLQASVRAEVVAELVFEENKLLRVDYETQDQALRDRFQARLDTVLGKAQREGLHMDFHQTLPDGARGWFLARPKPGEAHFTKAMLWHLGDDTFTVRRK
ncbi:hypothetical protein [Chondromyces crocatus]|uniref:Secreted protein n=1 Tax=Chondromyces crocatus TaxID=52 RepID=A0A0K1EAD6_CHOCO|nr:hypothetical protein [Chondromyces crocatus]AKT37846.1 uncharacterized protein CMC5_019890 [Chondromyces crocatus]